MRHSRHDTRGDALARDHLRRASLKYRIGSSISEKKTINLQHEKQAAKCSGVNCAFGRDIIISGKYQ